MKKLWHLQYEDDAKLPQYFTSGKTLYDSLTEEEKAKNNSFGSYHQFNKFIQPKIGRELPYFQGNGFRIYRGEIAPQPRPANFVSDTQFRKSGDLKGKKLPFTK